MPNVITPLVAILATPLSQTPLPHVLRLSSWQPLHQCPFPTPPPLLPQRGRCQGKRRAVRILSEHVCPPLPPCRTSGGGGDTDMELAADGSASPLPLPSEGGRMEPSYTQRPPIVTKAHTLLRPNSLISHPYPPHSGDWSERGENHIYSHPTAPTPWTGVGQEREMPRDR